MAWPLEVDINQSRKDSMTEQRDRQRPDAAQDDPALQDELATQQSRTLSVEELEAVAGGPTINNGP
jgi:hypothetical protein